MTKITSMLLVVCVVLAGCAPEAVKTETPDAQALVDSLVYVKSRSGLCFGVSTTARVDTGGRLSYTNQIVHVPCANVGL